MKKRTRVIAWIFLIVECCTFLLSLIINTKYILNHTSQILDLIPLLSLLVVQGLLWLMLLKEQKWAWWVLTIEHTLLTLGCMWCSGELMISYLTHQKFHIPIVPLIVLAIFFLAIYGTTFWVLLTDRPSGWAAHPTANELLDQQKELNT